jgi:two-component system, chemotaxis family, chemotaxis protein CheY
VPTALVVDDSRAVRMIVGRAVKELGYEVREASNGKEAMQSLMAETVAPDLALLDWNMPEMNGFEVLKKMRAESRFASTIVVMVTTETEIEQIAAALEAGANEYIMKPFTREILIDRLRMAGAQV